MRLLRHDRAPQPPPKTASEARCRAAMQHSERPVWERVRGGGEQPRWLDEGGLAHMWAAGTTATATPTSTSDTRKQTQ